MTPPIRTRASRRLVESPVWIERIAGITSEATGIFTPVVARGTYVQKGMKVGSR